MAAAKGKPPAGKTSPAGSGSASTAGKKTVAAALARKPSRKVVKDMLLLELRRLRAMFTEIAERYVADAEGGMAAVIETVERKSLPAARLDGMLRIVRGLSIKPRKGRRKDLARIEKVVASVRKELGE
ncbi:MAG: hypothetical protein A2Z26_05975 [Deltaproteobacteria bacterium RBG_16_66_15]|nr:MAG: hypothetical protein A2X90_11305 [Deltaproteobacteria bacterium GWA2_65_63]OGP27900.1 MAG: hypothetical protein A2X91_03775 [Deltaproteobacteria bacterium GWB2_65_81]OGP36584.1 MAG: hypothetical protein A2X98_02685 [Deltaproteobacteria bacterium GWC2_66_88]OGP79361.1 MAG: hypothetical protein A2Z26_05975 [Deltaproteobacteria bacterium RBG_16_66_15]HAM33269.1 hypothetical protein [Deltaproteobacteria bacterium]